MANCRVRTEGRWTAGFYFNNALFRVDAVYHRTLKIFTSKQAEKFEVLVRTAHELFKRSQKHDWESGALKKINHEVNGLKHAPEGILKGRDVRFAEATQAVGELLVLLEAAR